MNVDQNLENSAVRPLRRAILLGASNLTIGFRSVVDISRELLGGPLDIHTALGHGRSYGLFSKVFIRGLPSILECGIWERWKNLEPLPTTALITDVGVDLFYNADAATTLDWVREVVTRLRPRCERIVMTLLPVNNAERLAEWEFTTFRRLFFSGCRLGFSEMTDRAHALNDGLRKVASEFALELIAQPPTWYGWDPIHYKKSARSVAWRTILDSWRVETKKLAQGEKNYSRDDHSVIETTTMSRLRGVARLGWWQWWGRSWPESQTIFDRWRSQTQPVTKLRDGTRISLY